jgi:hemoglobin-like flavoprotein
MSLTGKQRILIFTTVDRIEPMIQSEGYLKTKACSSNTDDINKTISGVFYTRLFSQNPELHTLFKRFNLLKTLRAIVKLLVQKEISNKEIDKVQSLGQRHVRYGVQSDHYQIVGNVLIDTFSECLAWFTDEFKYAWNLGWDLLSQQMMNSGCTI